MFTGVVVRVGIIRRARLRRGVLRLAVEEPAIAKRLEEGGSVAVNGVCLTAVASTRKRFEVEAVPETVRRTTLGELERGASVNLELPVRPTEGLGGHIVQGHVDGIGEVSTVGRDQGAWRVWFRAQEDLLRYVVAKGSVTVDGVSLTVVEAAADAFEVALIPHTRAATTLGALRSGSRVNVEVDVIAKYVERLVLHTPKPDISMDFLHRHGFG